MASDVKVAVEATCQPFCVYEVAPATTVFPLNYLVMLQNQVLQQVADQNAQIAGLINRISLSKAFVKTKGKNSESKELDQRPLRLVLTSDLPNPVLKERGFELAGAVQDASGAIVPAAAGASLSLSIFTQDQPTKSLDYNIAGTLYPGKKVLRGTVTATIDSSGRFLFPNVVINEVSSHYIDDVFTLKVTDSTEEFRPLVMRRLTVRARKARRS